MIVVCPDQSSIATGQARIHVASFSRRNSSAYYAASQPRGHVVSQGENRSPVPTPCKNYRFPFHGQWEPIGSSGEAEDAEEGVRGLFVACGNGTPLLEPCPEVLDEVAVVVDPLRAGDGRVGTPGRDGGPCAQVPDALAKGQTAITSFNRNWANRMGVGGLGYLASPAVVAASAMLGYMGPPSELGIEWSAERFV